MNREALVDQQLPERRSPARVPVRVVAARVVDRCRAARCGSSATCSARRARSRAPSQSGISSGSRPRPSVCRFVCAGEVLEAHEGDAASVDDQLAGVGGADADHQNDVDVTVDGEQFPALLLGVSRERHHVGALEHRAQIGRDGGYGRPNDVREMRTVGIDDVVVPVRLEDFAVGCRSSADRRRVGRCYREQRKNQAAD